MRTAYALGSKWKLLNSYYVILSLDELLEGGLHCRQIYEICGNSSSGKSQLCHWISLYSTLNGSTNVHYIDGSRNFFASRIQMVLDHNRGDDKVEYYLFTVLVIFSSKILL